MGMGSGSTVFIWGGQGRPLQSKVTFEKKEVTDGAKCVLGRGPAKAKALRRECFQNVQENSKGPSVEGAGGEELARAQTC